MPLPGRPNITFDVYHNGQPLPPDPPNFSGVGILREAMIEGNEQGDATTLQYSHILLVELEVDIRDSSGVFGPGGGDWDRLYVPDLTGTLFAVRGVIRSGYNTGMDHRIVYLWRGATNWPTSYV